MLQHELFAPILAQLPNRFAYQGPARDYFARALEEQVELNSPLAVRCARHDLTLPKKRPFMRL